MRLETDLVTVDEITLLELRRQLDALDAKTNSRAILSTADEIYIQTGAADDGWVLERRDGDEDNHAFAVPLGEPPLERAHEPNRTWWQRLFALEPLPTRTHTFPKEDVVRVFLAYFDGREADVKLRWDTGYSDR